MAGPTVRKRQLGIQLRQLRANAHETREQVAALLGCSPTRATYLETGRNVIRKTELIVLLQHYGVEDRLEQLEELRQEANKRGWWSTARLPEWLAGYVGLETEAAKVCAFETLLIPGLLQTEGYAREVHLLRGELTESEMDRRVAARMRRQARLTARDSLELSAVVCEAALRLCVDQPDEVALAQLRHLRDQAQLPNVELRVLLSSAGRHSGMSGAFTLLSFPDGLLADVAWQEYALGGHIIEDKVSVASLTTLYSKIRSQALGRNESLELLADLAENTH